jgi:hypothetical protein
MGWWKTVKRASVMNCSQNCAGGDFVSFGELFFYREVGISKSLMPYVRAL